MLKNFFLVAYRTLVKNKATTVLNISGLAIGVAVCLVIGIWLQRELSFDNFHPNGEQIFRLANTFKSESESFSQAPSGPAFGAHLTEELPSVKTTCRVFGNGFKVKTGNEIFIENNAAIADQNFFNFFGFKLLKGSPEQALQSPDKVVITEKLAIKYFASVNEAMGKTIVIDGEFPKTISAIAENIPINSQIQFDLLLPYSHLSTGPSTCDQGSFIELAVLDHKLLLIDQITSRQLYFLFFPRCFSLGFGSVVKDICAG